MRANLRFANWAGLVVVVVGSVGFLISVFRGDYEIATMCVGFTMVGLYLLFGKEPPTSVL